MQGIHNRISVVVCEDVSDAVRAGYDYSKDETIKPIDIEKIVVVRRGTEGGNPTVDFILRAEDGSRYVFMLTGRLLKSIPC